MEATIETLVRANLDKMAKDGTLKLPTESIPPGSKYNKPSDILNSEELDYMIEQ